jgi:hypothetical protein
LDILAFLKDDRVTYLIYKIQVLTTGTLDHGAADVLELKHPSEKTVRSAQGEEDGQDNGN